MQVAKAMRMRARRSVREFKYLSPRNVQARGDLATRRQEGKARALRASGIESSLSHCRRRTRISEGRYVAHAS